jgi:hypothetical protein
MVDKSTSPCKRISDWFSFIRTSRETVSSSRSPPPSALSFTELSLPFREPLLASGALNRPSRGPAAEENRGLPPLSIVGWFCRLPWLESAGGSIAPDGCHLALAAGRALLGAKHGDAQSASRLATTRERLTGVKTAAPSPRCGVRERPPHVGQSD